MSIPLLTSVNIIILHVYGMNTAFMSVTLFDDCTFNLSSLPCMQIAHTAWVIQEIKTGSITLDYILHELLISYIDV